MANFKIVRFHPINSVLWNFRIFTRNLIQIRQEEKQPQLDVVVRTQCKLEHGGFECNIFTVVIFKECSLFC
jgi:hypothetical protein